jgi:hypothetical protein
MGFANDIIGGAAALIRAAIKSPNYVPATTGWSINKDGSADFASLTIRGTFHGTNFEITAAGAFFYSGTPAAGNLILSISASTVAFTDRLGNHCVPLTGWYDNAGGFFTQAGAGFMTFGTGSLAAGWTANTSIQNDVSGDLLLNSVGGSVQINGSSSTGPGDNGGVTSGPSGTVSAFPAAGPNHTHAEFHHHPL